VHNAKTVQVPHSLHNLEDDGLCAFLRQLVVPLGNVIEEIFALHEFQHNEVVLGALKQVDQLDDVLMLAHLEHLDLSPLLEDLNRLHVGLVDGLNRDLAAFPLVLRQLDHAKLTLAKVVEQVVVVVYVELADDLADGFDPARLRLLILEVQDT